MFCSRLSLVSLYILHQSQINVRFYPNEEDLQHIDSFHQAGQFLSQYGFERVRALFLAPTLDFCLKWTPTSL